MDIYFDQFATDSRAGAISLTQPPPEPSQQAVRAVTQRQASQAQEAIKNLPLLTGNMFSIEASSSK
tara:strand:+ start:428 stop:625 length:198 start_codon:yes stop_codon:yes gene_type:complete